MEMNALIKKELSFLDKYLKRDDLVEICINKENEVWLEMTSGEWQKKADKNITRHNVEMLTKSMATLSGQKFDEATPMFAGRLPKYGHRVQVNIGAQVVGGVSMSIRVGKAQVYPINSYMPDDEAQKLIEMVKDGKTILISAGTGSGKTTFLNSLIKHIPKHLRIITLEDTEELIVPHPNCVQMLKSKTGTDVAKLGYQHYVNTMMRMRPDRILLGEIDTENTMVFLNLANSGHSGSISTIHSESEEDTFNRLCLNASMSGSQGSKTDHMEYAKAAIDVIVSLKKEIINGERKFSAKIVRSR